jgi:hypothetical protein
MPDLAIFPVPISTNPDTLSDLNVLYRATDVSLGIDKFGDILSVPTASSDRCIQQVIRVLLSDKGSIPSEPGYGSTLGRFKEGYNPDTILEDVILILLDVENQCKSKDLLSNIPVTAKLQSLELLDLGISNNSELKLSIGVTTVSGIAKSFDLNV